METKGAFHSTKIPVWNLGNFTCPVERYGTFRLQNPTQATARLVIVLVSRGQQFCQMERYLSVRPTGQRGPASKLVTNIPGGPNPNGLFHMMYQPKFPKFGVECKVPKMIRILINSSKSLLSKLFFVLSFFMTNSFGVLKTYTGWTLFLYVSSLT